MDEESKLARMDQIRGWGIGTDPDDDGINDRGSEADGQIGEITK
jgi:hypothetical protein